MTETVDSSGPAASRSSTWSGIPLKPSYGPADSAGRDYDSTVNDPGAYPFTRGKYQQMYRDSGWISRNLAGLSSAADTNVRLKYLLSHGQGGLAVVPDTATQSGLDYDHPFGQPLVGLQGVPLACREDMRVMCADLDLHELNASFSTFQTPVAAQYLANAMAQGFDHRLLRGSIQNDPICARLTGYDPGNPLDVTMRMAIDSILWCAEHAPRWHSTVVNTYILREAGADAFQEMGYGLEVAFYYIEEAVARGMDVDQIAPRFAIIAGLHNDFFEEIAKLRAARRIWADELGRRFGAKSDKSKALTISVHTCGSTLTASQPINNVVRAAYQALAAVLGGCRGLDLSGYDEPFSIPSAEAATIAMRTHAVLDLETGVASVADPLGGSYYMESLTDDVERRIREVMDDVAERGGIRAAHDSGYVANQIDDQGRERETEIDAGQRPVVG
ncbi:MAG: methylmalonyl-CoA mutase, N-terminal domain, partial [Nocardioidaceae bacterium]|nr:methylmalonyl-CoA mutase, N-terminal domain [Nocardioidaceae bacterium]